VPPSNLTPATAIDITSFPFTVSVDPGASGNILYYKLTGPAANCIVGILVDNPLWTSGHYLPEVSILDSGLANYLGGFSTSDNALQVPVSTGQQIYIKIRNVVGTYTVGDLVNLSVILPPNGVVAAGNLLINDDTNFFPMCIIDIAGNVVKFLEFPAGERGEILPSGISLWQDRIDAGFNPAGSGVTGDTVSLFNASFVKITDISGIIDNADVAECIIVSNRVNKFYVVRNNSTSLITVKTIDNTGAVGVITWTLPTNAVRCIAACPNRAETILYYASGNLNQPVRRYDLVNNIELSTFYPGQGVNYSVLKDILVLADGTIVIAFYNNAGSVQTTKIIHFDSTGTILRQWNYNGNNGMAGEVVNRIVYNKDDSSSSFWVWLFMPINSDETIWEFPVKSKFLELSTVTGAILQSIVVQNFSVGKSSSSGVWDGRRFGPSTSCPFLLMPTVSITPPEPLAPDGIYFVSPNKATRHDSYYNSIEKKIPNPAIKTALLGE